MRSPRKAPPNAELLTQEQELAIREALKAGATRREAAAIAGISYRRLGTRLQDQLFDLRVGRGRRERNRRSRWHDVDDPDPATIAERTAEIRSRWTDEEADQRRLNFTGPLDLT
jgi:hypothetical protein